MRTHPNSRAAQAAAWMAEALASGSPLATFPPELAPRGAAAGGKVALLALESLGLAVCGVRLTTGRRGVVGPMLESRLLADGAAVPLTGLRGARASAALIGVLAAPLAAADDEPPILAALHPAIDLAATRFSHPPADAGARAADLGGLGLVVAGAALEARSPLTLALGGAAGEVDLWTAMAAAAAAARRRGGLPAGSLLVVVGLTPALTPRAGEALCLLLGGQSAVTAWPC